ncbi:bifunctional [glutamate--ammonia ligase]-adenylyl-L-tyrosine phosphorylase/[glutamate--ammonia-ligase] adenylyltransferase [soil metagenome]
MLSEKIQTITRNLPDSKGAENFYSQLIEKFPLQEKKLAKNEGLLSDVLTLAAFSPLLATTLLQNPNYIWWLNRQRISAKVRGKEEILESLARFALTNSQIEPNILLARFRRRELLRIYLRDIRNLGTIAEITEEISNLADAILEYALRQSQQELDNRYGIPLEIDEKGRAKKANFCIVALGKLGSNELNYASDIDLLFLYSNDGTTSGQGSRDSVTNREYFVKLAEFVTKTVGGQTGEGAAYRVDLRLRPHGRVGALAISVNEAVNYYQNSAQSWERQVLIRSRACAGETKVFYEFFEKVKSNVFSKDENVENALQNVLLSKEKINLEKSSDKGFNVKLGKGGIREIEFIAQALQIAYGGKDSWLRAPHTLISLSRLADRKLLTETELTELFDAYDFLRRLEHRLQMENGLQTHLVPNEAEKCFFIAKRMNFEDVKEFENALKIHSKNVNRIFSKVFGQKVISKKLKSEIKQSKIQKEVTGNILQPIFDSLEKSDIENELNEENLETLRILSETSPHFAEIIAANPNLIADLPKASEDFTETDYQQIFFSLLKTEKDFAQELAVLRKTWSRFLLEIVVFDVYQKITTEQSRQLQTKLAEASIEAALLIVKKELSRTYDELQITNYELPLSVLGLGKLGSGGLDYGSDLDLVLVFYEVQSPKSKVQSPLKSNAEMCQPNIEVKKLGSFDFGLWTLDFGLETFYARTVEIFITTLSSLTRDGFLYRVDLRLRPDGKNGATSLSKTAFLNYLENRSAIWEWLAYVKLRGAAGDLELAKSIENEAREIIHENARKFQISDSKFQILREETTRIRYRLEEEKAKKRRGKEIDIKFGAGGMLDVYFAVRFLQLRWYIPDEAENRSTLFTLEKLYENNSLSAEDYQNFSKGYEFLTELDHNLRLTVGRSTRLPAANQKALQTIVKRMNLSSVQNLLENLTFHRLNIRASFENVLEK